MGLTHMTLLIVETQVVVMGFLYMHYKIKNAWLLINYIVTLSLLEEIFNISYNILQVLL